jgi:peptidoglycan/xylan/chitin deacetylase (PgdA/CDA1 family)
LKRILKLLISLLVRAWDLLSPARPVCAVLYYHAIDAADRARFARQMDTLLRTAKPVRADIAALPPEPGHYCAVTFDDGFVSVIENALPELDQRNIPATLFVPTGSLGTPPAWVKPESPARRERVLSATQLAALSNHPLLAIGSHSISHPRFLRLSLADARSELERSKAHLESILERKVTLFSFPHGECDAATIRLSQAAGYTRVFTISPSIAFTSAEVFVQGRVLADPADWPLEFRLKVLGCYRWLAKDGRRTTGPECRPQTTGHETNLPALRNAQ